MSRSDDQMDREVVEELGRFFSLAFDLLCIADAEGRFQRFNGPWEKTLGYPLEELQGRRIVDLAHSDDLPHSVEAIGRLSAEPSVTSFVNRCRCRDGTYRWIEWRASLSQGTRIYAAARDITERMGFEKVVLEQKSTLETVMANMAQAMFIADADLRVVAINRKFEPLFGFAPGEMRAGESTETLIRLWAVRTRTSEAQLEKVLHALREKKPSVSEFWQRVGDGPTTWIQLFHNPLPGGGFVRTYTDVTERKRAEEALKRSEERHRLLAQNSHDVIWTMDLDGGFTYVSPSVERLSGYTAEETMQMSVGEVLMPGSAALAGESLGRTVEAVRAGRRLVAGRLELEHRCQAGGTVWAEVTTSGMYDASGAFVGLLGVTRDITERRRSEESLREAKEAAEAASQAKSAFLANMSHEIRTPLNGVLGMANLVRESAVTTEQRDWLDTLTGSAEALLTIINDILDFSKIEAGKFELESLDFDLRSTLDDVVSLMVIRAAEKGLKLVCLVADDVPALVRGDPGRVRQVLLNLVGNALKFSSQGSVAIEVGVESEDEAGAVLRFAVRDTGIGIAAEKLLLLFEPFTQADSSVTRKYGGTGLGLSISRRLTELMGGRIGVESVPGKGSTFWFTARLARRAVPEEEAPEKWEDLRGLKVLVADDSPTCRRGVAEMLADHGCRHEEVTDAEAALERIRDAVARGDPFQVAILDMALPRESGESLGRRIKQDPALCQTVLVMLTAVRGRGDAARLRDAGFAGYLTKPCGADQLHDCLATVMGGRTARGDRPAAIVTRHTLAENRKRRARILLAEDNVTNQKVALGILNKLGYRADVVPDGVEAIRALSATPYDLVLMDVQMPELDGFEATRQIRAGSAGAKNATVPVIAMTAHAMKGDREVCLAAGMNDYLSKPIRAAELGGVLARWLEEDDAPSAHEGGAEDGATEPDVLDLAALVAHLGGDRELAEEILGVFLVDGARQIEELNRLARSGDLVLLRHGAHTLKGAAANVSAGRLRDLASNLEEATEQGDLGKAAGLVARIEDSFASFRVAAGAKDART